jgi:hypothetical protein
MNTPYNLSKDYCKLFEIICKGQIAVGFVDYKHLDFCMKDVCQIRRDKENYISIGVRGYGYGSMYPFCLKDSGKTEKEYFIWLCEVCNLEWVLPN